MIHYIYLQVESRHKFHDRSILFLLLKTLVQGCIKLFGLPPPPSTTWRGVALNVRRAEEPDSGAWLPWLCLSIPLRGSRVGLEWKRGLARLWEKSRRRYHRAFTNIPQIRCNSLYGVRLYWWIRKCQKLEIFVLNRSQ